jgi:PIN domain nuclease of toxin-antitoxin system
MEILLDTHVLLWMLDDTAQLSPRAVDLLQDPSNKLYASVASFWEMAIKQSLGNRLSLTKTLHEIAEELTRLEVVILAVELSDAFAVEQLPLHHRDPFDRLLITQAQTRGFAILSRDNAFKAYPVQLEW